MEKSKLDYSLKLYREALLKLDEALQIPVQSKDDIVIDGSIQRFEFTFEMCWKTLKRFLEHKGISAKTPRDVLKQAFKLGWLGEDDTLWVQMIDDRNQTSHTYNRDTAEKVYSNLKSYLSLFKTVEAFLRVLPE